MNPRFLIGSLKGQRFRKKISGLSLRPELRCRSTNWFKITAVFNWTGNHNVALPTKEQYDNCSDLQSNLGSPVSVELTAGSNYYFCTVGDHCEQGQKVTITVGSSSPTFAPPSGAHATVASLLLGLISSALAISFFTSM
ncbi:hypothetical protein ACLB2K_000274 [Fragaria x ananassa]